MEGHTSPYHPTELAIDPATQEDLGSITDIYNHAIIHTSATFDTQPRSLEEQTLWFEQHGDSYPILVARTDNRVMGWAALSPWSDRCAYETTAEVSIYVEDEYQGQGVGARLMKVLLDSGRRKGLHLAVARIVEGNPASLRLHKSAGFRLIGTMTEAGYKFEHYLDVIIMEKILDGSRT
jgi:phosphinothricin acetyltransferase